MDPNFTFQFTALDARHLQPQVRWALEKRTELLGVDIPTTVLPVSPGRNIAVVVEVAARNFLLKKLGYDTSGHFAKRMESIFEGKK